MRSWQVRNEPLIGRRVGPGLSGEMVDVLVKDGLQPPVDTIASDHPPVRPIVPACARVCVQAVEEQRRIGSGEQSSADRRRGSMPQAIGPVQSLGRPALAAAV